LAILEATADVIQNNQSSLGRVLATFSTDFIEIFKFGLNFSAFKL